ncbi:hypothetical protein P170DRAFT_438804 [Aspergillus steynii IBT 23096]|uniref:Glycosyl transferase CAP10 domain-containing protein n=1 Tax=Aspergillus steynii IBT 23096 TaxID=1392250 RepID=A0A2I2G2H4_9EURO|nr:uncharacterized protein P170DRAFT_438804 [Aspergillus steynii IBT 23096]PLB47083.1 hypothetical protein P170DRAFT_438804 [Aspergillus steynii IBT 23096]
MLPSPPRLKLALWSFSLVSLVPFLDNMLHIRAAQSSLIHSHDHPIEALIHESRLKFEGLIKSQSANYSAACDEYVRRYGVPPPPGFEAWFEYAKRHHSPIIDDFDTLYSGISPFWRQTGEEFLQVMSRAYHAPNSELWLCEFSGSLAHTSCRHPYRARDRSIQFLFNTALGDLRGALPDIKFLVNHLDEPRVMIPPDPRGSSVDIGQFNITDFSRQSVMNMPTKPCSSQVPENRHLGQQPSALPLVADRPPALDLCRHPEYGAMHGLLMSPTTFRLIEGLVPVLSTGALSTMGDILYPSPAYIEPEFQYTEAHDVEWAHKRNTISWAGSTTGGFVTNDDQWPHFHRQRFVALAQNLHHRHHPQYPYYYLHKTPTGAVHLHPSSFLNTRLFDVAFTTLLQCTRPYCAQQRSFFRLKPRTDKHHALRARLVFDTDGNGISGRFHRLLASKSAPLKQTLLREWHDDRLVPWVHFIPVSQAMHELPEMVSYLMLTGKGRGIAKDIADQGRVWFGKALRDVVRAVYLYRLMLEMARLQDPERGALVE